MTSSYLNEMYDVTGVNVFPRKLMKFPSKKKVNSVPSPLLLAIFRVEALFSTYSYGLFLKVKPFSYGSNRG